MTLHIDDDCIRKQIELKAPLSRVWRALTDHREFSSWFGVTLEAPFVAGQPTAGQLTYPGYEHLRMEVFVEKLEPEHYFSFTWHPYAVRSDVDYSQENPTLVEFTLHDAGGNTSLTVSESGFSKLPPHRREEAFRMNDGGWSAQLQNIERHVA